MPSGLIFVFTVVFMAQVVSASFECTVCQSGWCPQGANILNLSDDSVHIGSGDMELRCWDTAGVTFSNNGRGLYNTAILRVTELQNGHAERGDYFNYPYLINISSNDARVSCGYVTDCSGYQTCVVSLSSDTNAHVSDCSKYGLKLCCNSSIVDNTPPSATMGPLDTWVNGGFTVSFSGDDGPIGSGISMYNIQNRITMSDGSLVQDWTEWLQTASASAAFMPTANNQTYQFRASATDKAGNTGGYSAPVSTTFDSDLPNIDYAVAEPANKKFMITSNAWDGVSGISSHNISCTVTNPVSEISVRGCPAASPFGGISSCQISKPISYTEETEINCDIMAKDMSGNTYSTGVFFAPSAEHPLVAFPERTAFISIGETYHANVHVRNLKPGQDIVSISLSGIYPKGFATFEDSPHITWISPDRRNITVPLRPYERKTLHIKIISTDVGEYDMNVFAGSQNFGLTDYDSMDLTIGFPAAFTGIEFLSVLTIIVASVLIYWKIRI